MSEDLETGSRRVVFFYDDEVGDFDYGYGHPMKPHRIRITQHLVIGYGLDHYMRMKRPERATFMDMTRYHTADYINFLRLATPSDHPDSTSVYETFNIGEDSPVFHGLYEYCQISAGGSISGAKELNDGTVDVAINWAGGLHHAKKAEASGFCYVADCVLGILKLLEHYRRVMYIDIDIHHGDGVEQAFYTTDRVLTVSFHKYGNYFPGTGELGDIGIGKGKYFSVNVPLQEGITDEEYLNLFKNVIQELIEWYKPEAILLQCGADSLVGDRLGCFNITTRCHGSCVEFVKGFKIPVLVTGGGGYTVRNVARCWTYETSILVGQEISNDIPKLEFSEYFRPDYELHSKPVEMENKNTEQSIKDLYVTIHDRIRHARPAPSALNDDASSPELLLVSSDSDSDMEESIDQFLGDDQ